MKAVVRHEYGPPDVLALEDVEIPAVGEDDVLVPVRAASVNPYDHHMLTGYPYLAQVEGGLRKPKQKIPGIDLAGVVEAVGSAVTVFRPGDEVFGGMVGAYAEYARGKERSVTPKPANVSFEQAAAVSMAAQTALLALRDKGHIEAGQKVLVNGASGGVGTYAVQIAKFYGAEVTGVCSARNLDMVRSIGADDVIDYTSEALPGGGTRPRKDRHRSLTPAGRCRHQVSGNGDCHHGGRLSASTSSIHFTHQNPRLPGATRRSGAPCRGLSGAPPTWVARSKWPASLVGNLLE